MTEGLGGGSTRIARVIRRDSAVGGVVRALREAYLRLVGGSRGIAWELNGERYRIDPAFRGQIGHEYDPHLAEFFASRIRPGDVCFNVGANIGVYALQLARWAGPEGRVVAFEPNPAAMAVLRRHIEMNRLEDRVDLAPAAVSDEAGETVLFTVASDARGRLGAPNPELTGRADSVPVAVTTLDHYVASHGVTPDWLLIDIEGFEIRALAGARKLLEGDRKIRLVVEMHPNVWDTAGTSRADAERILAELHLEVIPLSGQADPLGDYGHVFLTRKAGTQIGGPSKDV